MKQSNSVTKDPICGMTVDETTAIHTERDGKTFYFSATTVADKSCPLPPVPSRRASLGAAVDKNCTL